MKLRAFFILSLLVLPYSVSFAQSSIDAGTEYLRSNQKARGQILNLEITPTTNIISAALTTGQAVSHMIEAGDASIEEVQKGINLLEILILPPFSSLDKPDEMQDRTKMRVNQYYTIRFHLLYNLVSLMEAYKDDYQKTIRSALLNLPLIAKFDDHSASRRLATLAYVSLENNENLANQFLNSISERDGTYIFNYQYDPQNTDSSLKSAINDNGDATYRAVIPFKVDPPESYITSQDNNPMPSGGAPQVSFAVLIGSVDEIKQRGEEVLTTLGNNAENILNQLRDSSTELSQKYYEMEVENHRLYSDLCSAPEDGQSYDFCIPNKILERQRLLSNITSSKTPLTTIQMLEAELEKIKTDVHKTLNTPPKSFSNGVSISASQKNREFAAAVLQIFEEGGDTSFETLLNLAIEEYALPNLFDRRSYANQ